VQSFMQLGGRPDFYVPLFGVVQFRGGSDKGISRFVQI
jgi:hypothetical protein